MSFEGPPVTVVVRFHASVLEVRTWGGDRPAELAHGRVRLAPLDPGCFEVLVAGERRTCRAGERARILTGDLDVTVDATVEATDAALSAVHPETVRSGAGQAASLAVHATALVLLFTFRGFMTDEVDLAELAPILDRAEPSFALELAAPEEGSSTDPHRGGDAKASGPTGAGATTRASRGATFEPVAGKRASSHFNEGQDALSMAANFGMISVLASHDARRSSGEATDPWSSSGTAEGEVGWGDPLGDGAGAGGLSLSGVGMGAGGPGAGVGEGRGFGASFCGGTHGCGEGGSGRARLGGAHRAKPPTVRLCGGRKEWDRSGGCVQTSGRLPPEVIQRVVRQNFGRFRGCYEALPRSGVERRVSVSFTIRRDGSVSGASGSGDDAALSGCVARSFSGLSFPAPEGGAVNVTYPIVFQPE